MQLSKQPLFVGVFVLLLVGIGAILFSRSSSGPVVQTALSTVDQNVNANAPDTTGVESNTPSSTQTAIAPGTVSKKMTPVALTKTVASLLGRAAPELVRPTGFTNIDALGIVSTEQFTLKRFFGKKVILLEFWTTSSVNSLRTMPYLNQWYSKYKNDGLLVVGVHTPEFSYEKSKVVVDQVAFAQQINFPIVIDNQYFTWNAYKNKLWPHLYLIDINGNIVYDHVGDGSYEATEAKLMELLTARAKKLNVPFSYSAFTTPKDAYPIDTTKIGSPETFFGADRNETLAGGVPLRVGTQTFEANPSPKLNMITLSGSWNFTSEYAQSMTENTTVDFRYRAANVYATLNAEKLTRVKVLRDGKPLDATNAGKEIRFEKGDSVFYVKDARIYEVIKDTAGYGEHTIELIPESGGLNIYVLMFG